MFTKRDADVARFSFIFTNSREENYELIARFLAFFTNLERNESVAPFLAIQFSQIWDQKGKELTFCFIFVYFVEF